MPEHLTLDALLRQNPKAAAEADRITLLRERVAELRKKGMKEKSFDLSSPFGQKLWITRSKEK